MKRTILRSLAVLVVAAIPAAGQNLFSRLTMVTSVPEDDYGISLAPGGQRMVFVSERTGDSELFISKVAPDLVTAPVQPAPSPADDHSPAVSPDSLWLAWISTREDAFGDVWVMPFPSGKPLMVSKRGMWDSNPRWRRSGSRLLLVFDSRDSLGSNSVQAVVAGNWKPVKYTADDPMKGVKLPFNAYVVEYPSSPGQPWVLVTDDTNGDGRFDGADMRCAWTTQDGRLWRQITPPIEGLNSPRLAGGAFVLGLTVRDNLDVAVVKAPFAVASMTNMDAAVEAAGRAWEAFPADPYTPVAYLRQAFMIKPRSARALSAICLAADMLREAHRPEQALSMLEYAVEIAGTVPDQAVECAYRREVLALEVRERDVLPPDEFNRVAGGTLQALAGMSGSTREMPSSLRARILLEQARINLRLSNAAAALSDARKIDLLDNPATRVRAQAALLRGRIYEKLAMPDETVRAYRSIVADYAGEADIAEEASVRLVDIAAPPDMEVGKRLEALQPLRADTLEGVRAAAGLAEGRLLAARGDVQDAIAVWESVAAGSAGQPRLAARAAFEMGGQYARMGEYTKAIEVFDSSAGRLRDQLFGGAPLFYTQARQRRIDESLAKGNFELQVADNRMALATFTELAGFETNLVEAWRGVIEAQWRCGLLDNAKLAGYARAAKDDPNGALSQYKYGLALSYRTPIPELAADHIRKAIILDGSVPFYHQTLGFIYEHYGRVKQDREMNVLSLREYQRAMALLLAGGNVRPADYGRLLINSANAALSVENNRTAADLYERRLQLGAGFDHPANEYLVYYHAGQALFRAGRPGQAATRFGQALGMLPKVVASGVMKQADVPAYEAELHDRMALALLNAGKYGEAAKLFADVAAAAPPRSIDRVRALRSRGFALHRMAGRQGGLERAGALDQAGAAMEEALAILDAGKLEKARDNRKSGGALLSLDVTVSSDKESGGSMLEFSADQEKSLLVAALARVQEDQGRYSEAIVRLRQQLAAVAGDRNLQAAYAATVRQVALDRLSGNLQRSGRDAEAADSLIDAVRNARFEVRGKVMVNGNGLSLALAGLTELALAGGDAVPFKPGDLEGTWLLKGAPRESGGGPGAALKALSTALLRALELRDPDTGEYRLQWGSIRARAALARALVLEGLSGMDLDGESRPVAAIRRAGCAVGAERIARDVAKQVESMREGGEAKRLALFAHALLVRAAAQAGGGDAAAAAIEDALAACDRYGYPDLRWWMRAQEAASGANTAAANAVLAELEKLAPGLSGDGTRIPYDLMRRCETASVSELIATNDWEGAWMLAERWRAARLRLSCGSVAIRPRPDNPADAQWLRTALELRDGVLRDLERIRELPASGNPKAERESLGKSMDALSAHMESGRGRQLPGALFLAPVAAPFADASILLEDNPLTPGKAALVLCMAGRFGAWTADGLTHPESAEDWAGLAKKAGTWYVMGDRLPGIATNTGATVVNMLTFETTLARMEQPRIAVETKAVEWPVKDGKDATQAGFEQALVGADVFRFGLPLSADGGDPARWRLGAGPGLLGNMLEKTPALGEIGASFAPRGGETAATRSAMEENLAALLAATEAATVRVNGGAWISVSAPIASMPDVAESWMAADAGRVSAYTERGEYARAVAPLRRIMAIRRALGRPAAEVAESAVLLAKVEGKLERWPQASEAAARAVDALTPAGDSGDLARALGLYGSFLNDARRFDESAKAYEGAAGVYGRLENRRKNADMLASSGVALENGGRYDQALEIFRKVRGIAVELDDKPLEIRQWRREGRVLLQRQNRYVEAEQAFAKAAEIAAAAGAKDTELLARLDTARVKERLGLYPEAIEIASAVAGAAQAAGLKELEADALLVRAYVEWAEADYFHAFKTQREANALAESINSVPLRIISHNTAGLISWALNDTVEAMKELDLALGLAEKNLFAAEVASTLNNRGLVRRSRQEYDLALSDFGGALGIDRSESNDWGIAYSQRNIGLTHIQRGEPRAALPPLEEAIRLATAIGDRANRAKALVAAGDAFRSVREAGRSRGYYAEALTESRAIPLPEVEWRALYGLALMDRAAGDRAAAEKMFTEAIAVVERLRASIRIEELQDGFLLDKQSLYDEMVALLLDAGKAREAFEFSERSRGRNFIDLLGNQKIKLSSDTDQAKIDREASLRARIEALEKQVSAAPGAQKAALEADLAEARRQYSQLMMEIRADNPQLSSFVAVPVINLEKLQGLLDADTRLVVYHVLPDELIAWVIGRNSFAVARTPVKRSELAGVLGTFRRRMQAFEDVSTEEKMLSGWLVAPVESLLAGAKRVGVVPHRELHLMPFAACRIGGAYFLDKYALFHAPSAGVIEYTFARRPAQRRDDRVLAIGNPDLGTKDLDLPFAGKEADRVSWTFPGAKVVKGAEATESWVTQNIGDYGIVHVASHGQYDPNMPLLSAVKLSADNENDGNLTAAEVFGLSLKADLVALSACQTGLGRVGSGDDIVGLNRAFVYAGTHEILSSLWRVDDVATAVLIKHFYRNLAGKDRAEALRLAQIEVRGRYPHPAYWSGMFLSGDWQ